MKFLKHVILVCIYDCRLKTPRQAKHYTITFLRPTTSTNANQSSQSGFSFALSLLRSLFFERINSESISSMYAYANIFSLT